MKRGGVTRHSSLALGIRVTEEIHDHEEYTEREGALMHFCGDFYHDVVVNALLLLGAVPLIRAYAPRVRAFFLTKEHECETNIDPKSKPE